MKLKNTFKLLTPIVIIMLVISLPALFTSYTFYLIYLLIKDINSNLEDLLVILFYTIYLSLCVGFLLDLDKHFKK